MAFNAHINITGSSSGAQQAVNGLGNSFKSAGANMASFVKGLTHMSQVNNQVRANVNNANNALSDFNKALAGLGTAAIGKKIYEVRNQFVGWENQLYAVTGSIQKATQELDDLIGVVKELGTDLTTAVTGFVQLKVAAKDSGLSSGQLLDIFRSFSGTLMLFNADTLKVEGTFRALTQMFSKGVVQAEELRGQLAEHLPGALQIAARAMNTTTWDLGDKMKKGMLDPTEVVLKMAQQMDKELGAARERAMDTSRGAYNRLITEVKLLMNQIGAMLERDFINAINIIAGGAKEITQIFKDNSKIIMLAIHALGGYALAWAATATAVGLFHVALKLATINQWLFNAAANANPYLKFLALAISALGILSGAIYDSRNAMVKFNDTFASVGSWSRAALSEAEIYFSYVKHEFNALMALDWGNLIGQIMPDMPDFSELGVAIEDALNGDTMDFIVGVVNKLITGLLLWFDIWVQIGQFIANDLGKIIDRFQDLVEELFKMLGGYIKAVGSALKGLGQDIAAAFTGDFSFSNMETAWNDAVAKIDSSWNLAMTNLKQAWSDAMSDFEIKVDWDYNWIDGWSAKVTAIANRTMDNIAQRAAAVELQLIDTLLRAAEVEAVHAATGMTPEQIAAGNKAYGDMQTDVKEKTDEAIKKTAEYREELRLLKTIGFEATQKAMVTYIANMEYLTRVQELLASGIYRQIGGQAEFDAGMAALEVYRQALIDSGMAKLELDEANKAVKKSMKEEEKELKAVTKALLDARDEYLELLNTIADVDMELRDHSYMYQELTERALGYSDALSEIARDRDAFVRTSLDIPVNITSTSQIHDEVAEMMDTLRSMDPVDIPIEFKTDGVLDIEKVMADIRQQSEDAAAGTGMFAASLDDVDSSSMRTSNAVNQLGISFTNLAKTQNLLKTSTEQVAKAKDELQAAYNATIKLEEEYGSLSNLSIEQQETYQRAVDNTKNALDRYNAARARQYEADLKAISLGTQTVTTYAMTDRELLNLASSYNTAWAKQEEFKKAVAEINRLLAEGKMTEYEAGVAKLGAEIEKLSDIAYDIGSAFDDAFKSIIEGADSLEDVIKNLLKSLADAIYKEFVSKQIIGFIGGLFTSGVTKSADGNIMTSSGAVDLKRFANGGIAANDPVNLKMYSTGGIANKPQLAMFGEGSTPEAYVPLPDGRSIPVTMKAEGTKNVKTQSVPTPEVKVVVNNMPGQNAEVSRDSQGGLTIDIVRSTLAADINKGGTPWVGAIERKYGMSRGRA